MTTQTSFDFDSATVQDLLTAISAGLVSVPDRYCDRTFKLSGDVNALEYGAKYVTFSEYGCLIQDFSGRDWDGYENSKIYRTTEYTIDFSDLTEDTAYLSFGGYTLQDSLIDVGQNIEAVMCALLDVASGYGICQNGHEESGRATEFVGNLERSYVQPGMIEIS